MLKTIVINLFKTFIFSLIVSIAVSCLVYAIQMKGHDYAKTVPAIVSGMFYLNGILLIMSVPAVFTINPSIWPNPAWRLFLFFAGPLAFIITNLLTPSGKTNTLVYTVTGIVFFVIHIIFYIKLTKKISGQQR